MTQVMAFKENELHLWVVHAAQIHPRKEALLNLQEHSRANRFYSSTHGEHWAYFHCALREILARYTDLTPAELEFETVKNNKPVLKNWRGPLNFNLSHSHDMALVAVAGPVQVGVDIERIRALSDMDALAKRNFSPEECMNLFRVSGQERCKLFYDIWTRKEAVIKANGKGLSIPLHEFTTPLLSAGQWQGTEIADEDCARYLLCGFDLDDDYCASLCIELTSEQQFRDPILAVHSYQESL